MDFDLKLDHLRYYKILARLPQFALSYASHFRIAPKPVMMVWEATYRCPARCLACGRWHTDVQGDELSTAEGFRLIDEAAALGVRLLALSGGDPLVRSDAAALGRHARARGMITVLCTSGALINQRNVHDILRSFDVFEVSLDSLDPELHDRLRGRKGLFQRASDALEMLLAYRKPHQGVEITTVVRDENYTELGDINRRYAPLGVVTCMQPLHQNVYGATTDDRFGWAREHEPAWQRMVDDYQWYDGFSKRTLEPFFRQIPTFVQYPEKLRDSYTCFAGSYSFLVGPTGDVSICDALRASMGNFRSQSLREILVGLAHTRRLISSKQRQCNCWLLCITPPSLFLSRVLRTSGPQ